MTAIMIRGIRFKIPNKWGALLSDILQGISYDRYIWKINEDQVYTEDNNFLFTNKALSGPLFKKHISTVPYYTVFINLQAFSSDHDLCEIHCYDEFIHSTCEFAVFICDNIFVDIYVKSQSDLELFHKNALEHHFTKIEFITDTNDTRETFRALE